MDVFPKKASNAPDIALMTANGGALHCDNPRWPGVPQSSRNAITRRLGQSNVVLALGATALRGVLEIMTSKAAAVETMRSWRFGQVKGQYKWSRPRCWDPADCRPSHYIDVWSEVRGRLHVQSWLHQLYWQCGQLSDVCLHHGLRLRALRPIEERRRHGYRPRRSDGEMAGASRENFDGVLVSTATASRRGTGT